MKTDAGHPSTAKKFLVEAGIHGLSKYRRELALDLLYGRVRLPPSWLTPEQQVFVDLDEDDQQLNGGCRALVANVVRLCDRVIPWLIEDYLRRHAEPALIDRLERDSLRRGSGPAQVRDALFRTCRSWPSHDVEHLAPTARWAVDEGLDGALARRRQQQSPATADPVLVRAGLAEVHAGAHRYARRRKLNPEYERWLLSEVCAQFMRNVARGKLPENVAAWTTATARAKVEFRTTIDAAPPSRLSLDLARSDDGLAQVELSSTLMGVRKRLERRANDLRRLGDPENAAVHEISAAILLSESVDTITSFLADDDPTIADRLWEHGLQLSPERRRTAVRLIRDELRDALG